MSSYSGVSTLESMSQAKFYNKWTFNKFSKFLYGEIDKSIDYIRRYNPEVLIKNMESLGFNIELHRKLNFLGAIDWFIAGKLLNLCLEPRFY